MIELITIAAMLIGFSAFGFMAVAARNTASAPGAFTPESTPTQRGRIAAILLVKVGTNISAWDTNNTAAWDALVTSGDIILVGPATGALTKPSSSSKKGYGWLNMRPGTKSYSIAIEHLEADDNEDMWDRVAAQVGDWSAMFVMEDLVGKVFTEPGSIDLIPMLFDVSEESESDSKGSDRLMRPVIMFESNNLPITIPALDKAFFKVN